jgi:hypothetical protein
MRFCFPVAGKGTLINLATLAKQRSFFITIIWEKHVPLIFTKSYKFTSYSLYDSSFTVTMMPRILQGGGLMHGKRDI